MALTIIVSNRLPVSVKKVGGKLEYSRSVGGLATGMASLVLKNNTIWIGWPGIPDEDLTPGDKKELTLELKKRNCSPVFLTKKQIDNFYSGFSNSVLWQDFHNLPRAEIFPVKWWSSYREVNELFAKSIAKYQKTGARIWVHDYQLLLLPLMLRRQSTQASIGFFMHIPFPEFTRFASLPQAGSLVRGLLGADLIGFHTKSYIENFLETCTQLHIGVVAQDHVTVGGHIAQVSNLPLGIDYPTYALSARMRAVRKQTRALRRRYKGRKTILVYDRFDITKGFVERLRAYQALLEQHPEHHGKVEMIVIAAPTRSDIPVYQKLKQDVETIIADINGAFSTRNWVPVDYFYETIDFTRVNALYRVADINFETPLRDGMNLIAKEYVAAQTRKSGILILSKTAGAAEELTDAILVNPTHHKSLVAALEQALTMQPKESKRRIILMQKVLSVTSPQEWANTFMNKLKEASQIARISTYPCTPRVRSEIKAAYDTAKSPLFLFDYDGVLTPFFDKPEDARPSSQILTTVNNLANRKGAEVAIISGRKKADLEAWFGRLPVTLAAEHGAMMRTYGGKWELLAGPAEKWKAAIRPIMERFANLAPDTFVEEKSYSLVWHYRTATPYVAQKNLVQLRIALLSLAKKYKLGIYSGKKILEVKPPMINKGVVASRLIQQKHDFILAFGDDYTDEHMFAILPKSAYSIKVGPGATEAQYRIKDTNKVAQLLAELTS